jgi:hypothetical protein
MKKYCLFLTLLLTSCKFDGALEQTEVNKSCYDVVNVTSAQIKSPILINKCTGSTWLLLAEETTLEGGGNGLINKWFRIDITGEQNISTSRKR